jgi:hypothetical protein
MTPAEHGHRPDDRAGKRAPARVDSSTRVNVALPFSQLKIQEPGEHLRALTALMADLAALVAGAVPGPEAQALRRRADELASRLR